MAITPRRPAAAAVQKVKFLDMNAYSGGGNFDLPEGNYVVFFDFRFHAYTKADGTKGAENLGTMLTCYPLLPDFSGVGEPVEHFLSLGRKAKDSVMPNADDGGKSLVALPNGTGTLSRNTNSQLFFKSMLDAGMPEELASVDDLTAIDGVWVSTKNILEPEERKSYGNRAGTGEVEEQPRNTTPQKIPTVVEILEGGAPWDGGGGLPEEAPKKGKPAARPAAAPARPTARKPAPEPEPEPEDDDAEGMADAIRDALGAVLSQKKNEKGMTRVMLRMDAFKEIKKAAGDDGQQALAAMFEDEPEKVESLLGELGYKMVGANVKPV